MKNEINEEKRLDIPENTEEQETTPSNNEEIEPESHQECTESLMNDNEMLCTPEEFQKLILDNINYPYYVVNTEFSKFSWSIKEDLYAAATEGMVYAAKKFDPKRGDCKFISYAVHWIRYFINEYIRALYPVRFNQNFVIKRNKINRFIEKFKNENDGEMPTYEEISKNVGMSKKVVKNILDVNGGENFTFISFNTPNNMADSSQNDGNDQIENKLMSEYYNSATTGNELDKLNLDEDTKKLCNDLKSQLSALEFNVFYDYYFNEKSYSELTDKYNLKFPSKASYIVKKCEKKAKEIYMSDGRH